MKDKQMACLAVLVGILLSMMLIWAGFVLAKTPPMPPENARVVLEVEQLGVRSEDNRIITTKHYRLVVRDDVNTKINSPIINEERHARLEESATPS